MLQSQYEQIRLALKEKGLNESDIQDIFEGVYTGISSETTIFKDRREFALDNIINESVRETIKEMSSKSERAIHNIDLNSAAEDNKIEVTDIKFKKKQDDDMMIETSKLISQCVMHSIALEDMNSFRDNLNSSSAFTDSRRNLAGRNIFNMLF